MDLCRRQDEDHIFGRLFQCFQQRIERASREHMHFVDDVDPVFPFRRLIADFFADLPNIVDTIVRRSVDLYHIDRIPGKDRAADVTFIARASVDRMLAVDRTRKDLRHRCLTRSARSAEKISVADPA